MLVVDLSNEVPSPKVGDIVTYRPIDARNHNLPIGATMKVEVVRDCVKQPVQRHRWGVRPSRFLLTCLLPDGSHRAVYHVHVLPFIVKKEKE